MNKRGHVLNGLLLGVGVGFILAPTGDVNTLRTIVAVAVPVTLGALVPDIDTEFGRHRKTLHNLPVLGLFIAFPAVFGNLHYVWIGVLTHYVLDMVGSKRGIALFYPYTQEYGFPTGVATKSEYTNVVTLIITGGELLAGAALVYGLGQYGWSVTPLPA
ncbi:metal-dependent hydrolase [Halocatena pleomorpha]|uniref:Metal-dependent hydrolase n=1 Tax=Halocatena pleomorpha TaxID=1785090 RepID=A0A3P3RD75_9EURY|nr:metal-dependent hydrolase [Halocatena pleomorpha]RRJ30898.1 metal-dependent hydrolase [Halocatena pleomorpha]